MCLIAGLGNPGPKYAAHRHNVGFMVVDRLAARLSGHPGTTPPEGLFREKFHGHFARVRSPSGHDLVLLKPATFMNLSGRAVRAAGAFFKVELSDLTVVHDEIDLPFGTLRVKLGGGTAGHNGLKSIVEQCGGGDFCRLRVGVGRPRSADVQRHVLSDFSSQESAELEDVLERATTALVDVAERGPQAAMNLHNRAGTAP